MTKPLCRMTIKDLLDQIDEQESRVNDPIDRRKPNPLMYSVIGIDDAADYFDIHPEALCSDLKHGCDYREQPHKPIPFFRDLDIRL